MASDNPPTDPSKICSVHVQVPRQLLAEVDALRAYIQQSLHTHLVVSRGDVVRLALRRLYLSYLTHLSEQPHPPGDIVDQWDAVAAAMRVEGTVPDWLVPGASVCLLHRKKKGK